MIIPIIMTRTICTAIVRTLLEALLYASDRKAGMDPAQPILRSRYIYVVKRGKTAPNMDRRMRFAAMTDAAKIVYESRR